MAQPWAKAFYNSSRWNKCRKSFIEHRRMIDGGACQECHTNLGEIVHHRITLTEDNIKDDLVSLNFANLEYVCHKCHDEFEGHGLNGHGKIKPLCTFDSSGQPISLRDIDRPAPQEAASPQG